VDNKEDKAWLQILSIVSSHLEIIHATYVCDCAPKCEMDWGQRADIIIWKEVKQENEE
jgi:hypothetical protein